MPQMYVMRFEYQDNQDPPQQQVDAFVATGGKVLDEMVNHIHTVIKPNMGERCTISIYRQGDLKGTVN
jgi:hypothetical protein